MPLSSFAEMATIFQRDAESIRHWPVDEQMLQAMIERQREIRRLVCAAQCSQRAQRHFHVIRFATRLEDEVQFRDRFRQQREQGLENVPLFFGVHRIGQ